LNGPKSWGQVSTHSLAFNIDVVETLAGCPMPTQRNAMMTSRIALNCVETGGRTTEHWRLTLTRNQRFCSTQQVACVSDGS